MKKAIHETAIVSPGAKLGDEVIIGPYSVVGENVTIGGNVELGSHVVLGGETSIGDGCKIFPFVSLGMRSQDLKDISTTGKLIIGKNTIIREYVTMNTGTPNGGGVTSVGNNCMFMAYTHVAHDCHVGSDVIMSNVATLAGHVTVGDFVIIGGLAAVHQFVRIGSHSFIGGGTMVQMDIAPFMSASFTEGHRGAKLIGPNAIGLERRGFSPETIANIKKAYKIIWRSKKLLEAALSEVENELGRSDEIRFLVEFIRASKRGIAR